MLEGEEKQVLARNVCRDGWGETAMPLSLLLNPHSGRGFLPIRKAEHFRRAESRFVLLGSHKVVPGSGECRVFCVNLV